MSLFIDGRLLTEEERAEIREKVHNVMRQLIADGWKVWEIVVLGQELSRPENWNVTLSSPPEQE